MPGSYRLGREYKQKILSVVKDAKLPIPVETVRRLAGLKNWESTKALLLELVLEGRIKTLHTSTGWIFYNPETLSLQQLRY